MRSMKSLLFALIFSCLSSSALAVEIPETLLNQYVAQRLAEREQKGRRDVSVRNPQIFLKDGYATLCANMKAKVLAQAVDFCANMTPQWRQETGSLLATKMSLISLNAPGMGEAEVALLKQIVNQVVLPKLEGTEVYKADDFIGKQVSDLKVLPGKLVITP